MDMVETAEAVIKVRPGHQLARPHQGVANIDDGVQALTENVAAAP